MSFLEFFQQFLFTSYRVGTGFAFVMRGILCTGTLISAEMGLEPASDRDRISLRPPVVDQLRIIVKRINARLVWRPIDVFRVEFVWFSSNHLYLLEKELIEYVWLSPYNAERIIGKDRTKGTAYRFSPPECVEGTSPDDGPVGPALPEP